MQKMSVMSHCCKVLWKTLLSIHAQDPEVMFNIVTSAWEYERQTLAKCKADECSEVTESLYPDKVTDLNRIEMKVATFNYPPYAILQPLEGTEIRIALEYAQRHNCSLTIITDKEQWGQIFENGTGDGILGAVAEGRADMGLGALYLWFHEYQFLDFSVPYIRTGITCLAPRPKLVSSLLLPIRPFTLITWVIVVCSLTVASAALFLIKKLDILLIDNKDSEHKRHRHWFTTKADTILRTFGFLVLQASSNRTVETASIRQLVNWLHVMFFLVATSYCSGLASILTVPSYRPPIDTVEDLVDSGWQWGATHDAWVFSLREATEPPMSTLLARFRALTKEQLHYNSLNDDFAFSIERLPAGHYAIGDYITEESMKHLRLMKKDIYYQHCTLVFQKGSPYLKSFNVLIHRLLASGILFFWEGEVARKFLRSSVQSAVKESTTVTHRGHPTAIHFSQCEGAFILLGGGLLVGMITFLAELYISFRHSNRKKVVKFRVVRKSRHFH
ncbi:glutamate receptor-like [Homalodisca vitripennis]|uniref:glutamate receptor-like n=1 Tax=Homalodisca vitripennis TaxID=197043 RepID=UPI001EEB44A8|nr:glutamate receptor-like [Homalodisca vitripennis]